MSDQPAPEDLDGQAERLAPVEQLQLILDDLEDAWQELDAATRRVMVLAGQAQTYRVAIEALDDLDRDLTDDMTEPDTLTNDDPEGMTHD